MFRSALVFLVAACCVWLADGHSWLACVDYQCTGPAPADPATCECKGYPRNWATAMQGAAFSDDRGRDNRPGTSPATGGLVCDAGKEPNPGAGPVDAYYSAQYPMATLSQGQVVRQRWPAKNHATVGVQRGVQIYMSQTAGQGDVFPTAATAADIYAEMDFSNCDPRQAAVDAADCQDEFTISPTTPPGRYTMMWWWEFNAGEYYNTCADVEVVAGQAVAPGTPGGGAPDGGGGGAGGGGGGAINAPARPAISILVGECQTSLDTHQRTVLTLVPPEDVTYCSNAGTSEANRYAQVSEVVASYDLTNLRSTTTCELFLAEMNSLCSHLSLLTDQAAAGGGAACAGNGQPGGGTGSAPVGGGSSAVEASPSSGGGDPVGAGFLGFFIGLLVGALAVKFLLPMVMKKKAPPPPAAGLAEVSLAGGSGPSPPAQSLPAGWVSAVDPASGRNYYSNTATGASSWTVPVA